MKQLHFENGEDWRNWLAKNHDTEEVVWLIFFKKETKRKSVPYEDSVEEALCFGWIDSIIKKIDDEKYARKFTRRKDGSNWSEINKKRAEKMIKARRMMPIGLAKIKKAKASGAWNESREMPDFSKLPDELTHALKQNKKAKEYFDTLAPSYRRMYIGWIASAKRSETRERRIAEAVEKLERGEKLGLK